MVEVYSMFPHCAGHCYCSGHVRNFYLSQGKVSASLITVILIKCK